MMMGSEVYPPFLLSVLEYLIQNCSAVCVAVPTNPGGGEAWSMTKCVPACLPVYLPGRPDD